MTQPGTVASHQQLARGGEARQAGAHDDDADLLAGRPPVRLRVANQPEIDEPMPAHADAKELR